MLKMRTQMITTTKMKMRYIIQIIVNGIMLGRFLPFVYDF